MRVIRQSKPGFGWRVGPAPIRIGGVGMFDITVRNRTKKVMWVRIYDTSGSPWVPVGAPYQISPGVSEQIYLPLDMIINESLSASGLAISTSRHALVFAYSGSYLSKPIPPGGFPNIPISLKTAGVIIEPANANVPTGQFRLSLINRAGGSFAFSSFDSEYRPRVRL